MKQNGLTLIELMVVIAIIGILIVVAGFEFRGWMGSYRVESQTKEMYVDLMNARTRAMQTNRSHFVIVAANNYQVFVDSNGNGTFDAGIDTALPAFANPKTLTYPLAAASLSGTITMDRRGLVSPKGTINFDIGTNTPDYDCIVLFATRVNIGQMAGGNCVQR